MPFLRLINKKPGAFPCQTLATPGLLRLMKVKNNPIALEGSWEPLFCRITSQVILTLYRLYLTPPLAGVFVPANCRGGSPMWVSNSLLLLFILGFFNRLFDNYQIWFYIHCEFS